MHGRRMVLDNLFIGVSAAGSLFVLTEMVLQALGTSICSTEGCKLVAQAARFGDLSILLIGFSTFSLLTALALASVYSGRPAYRKLVNLVLIVSLACEGFFTGYQAFRVYTPCLFCLAVFGVLVILGLLRLLSGEKEITAGFAALGAVFSLFYLVLPAESTLCIPEQGQLVLFYSAECKYCREVMQELDQKNIPAGHILVGQYAGFLKRMGIENVPTLYVNNRFEKLFLTGKDEIHRYLVTLEKAQARTAVLPAGKRGVAAANSLPDLPGNSFQIIPSPSGEGLCKEDEICK